MRPELASVIGSEHIELILHRHDEHATVGDGRRAVDRRVHLHAPNLFAGRRLERRPDVVRIHRENTVIRQYRLRDDAAIAIGALARIRLPDTLEIVAEGEMIHRVIGEAPGIRPGRIVEGPRHRDLERVELRIGLETVLEIEHRDALARQRGLVTARDERLYRIAAGERGDQHKGGGKPEPVATNHGASASAIAAERWRTACGAVVSLPSVSKSLCALVLSPDLSSASAVSSSASPCQALVGAVSGCSFAIATCGSPLSRV